MELSRATYEKFQVYILKVQKLHRATSEENLHFSYFLNYFLVKLVVAILNTLQNEFFLESLSSDNSSGTGTWG